MDGIISHQMNIAYATEDVQEVSKRLLPAAKEVGLEEFVVTTIDKNKSGTCVATRQQVDMLASMCEDNRVKREEIPNIVGKVIPILSDW